MDDAPHGSAPGIQRGQPNIVQINYDAKIWPTAPFCGLCPGTKARTYLWVMENRVEMNHPINYLCCCWTHDNVHTIYYDMPPFSPACFGQCPGVFYKYEPKCCFVLPNPCYLCCIRPCCGETVNWAPCDNCICKFCCGFPKFRCLNSADEFSAELNKSITAFRARGSGGAPSGQSMS